jgi:hypothetical protein
MEALEKKPNIVLRFMRGMAGFFWGVIGFFTGLPGAVYALGVLLIQFMKWSRLEFLYWFRLFLYTSRNFLRLEALLTVVGAVLFFGYVITNDLAQNGELLIYYSYIYFSVVMVLLAMNVLPRERENGTLEILWSQPLRRSSIIVVQLITLSIWMFVLNLIWLGFIQYFTAYPEGKWILLILVWTTTIGVGALTLLVSTFCRHSIATGLVMMLILGLHFYWLTSIGPVQFFFIPTNLELMINPPATSTPSFGGGNFGGGRGNFGGGNNFGGGSGGASFLVSFSAFTAIYFDMMFNRITLIVTVGFILDFLFRRLRRTAEWFT